MDGMEEEEVRNVGSEHDIVSNECETDTGTVKTLKVRVKGMVKLNKASDFKKETTQISCLTCFLIFIFFHMFEVRMLN
jgi:hypothetical protein